VIRKIKNPPSFDSGFSNFGSPTQRHYEPRELRLNGRKTGWRSYQWLL